MKTTPVLRLAVAVIALAFNSIGLHAQSCSFNQKIGRHFKVARLAGNQALLYTFIDDGGVTAPDTLRKIGAGGQVIWTSVMPPNLRVASVAAASDSGFYAAGNYYGTFNYGGVTAQSKYYGAWVARYDKSGNLIWTKATSGNGNTEFLGISASANAVAVTGAFSDSLYFNGQVAKAGAKSQLIVATLNSSGIVQALKGSVGSTTTIGTESFTAGARGSECGIDGSGNVYVLTWAFGKTMLDTFQVGLWDDINEYGPYRQTIMKFDPALKASRKSHLSDCRYYCTHYNSLRVTQSGECYYIQYFSNGQSGNDDLTSGIHHLDANGLSAGSYSLATEHNRINEIDLDACENLYYTGYSRTGWHTINPVCYTVVAGRMTNSLTPVWEYKSASCNNQLYGNSVAAVGNNSVVVTGIYRSVIVLKDTLTGILEQSNFFVATLAGNVGPACITNTATNTTSINETAALSINFYPNPLSNKLHINTGSAIKRVTIITMTGVVVLESADSETDVSLLQDGFYLVRVDSAEGILTRKMLVRH